MALKLAQELPPVRGQRRSLEPATIATRLRHLPAATEPERLRWR
jgi:hypothetical protein